MLKDDEYEVTRGFRNALQFFKLQERHFSIVEGRNETCQEKVPPPIVFFEFFYSFFLSV